MKFLNFPFHSIASSIKESLADKVLHSCHALKISVSSIADLPVSTETNNNGPTRLDILRLNSIQMVNAFQGLLSHCTTWSSLYQNLQSALIHDLLTRMADHVRVIGGQIVRFLQVCLHFLY